MFFVLLFVLSYVWSLLYSSKSLPLGNDIYNSSEPVEDIKVFNSVSLICRIRIRHSFPSYHLKKKKHHQLNPGHMVLYLNALLSKASAFGNGGAPLSGLQHGISVNCFFFHELCCNILQYVLYILKQNSITSNTK